jgi:hypothetical protein
MVEEFRYPVKSLEYGQITVDAPITKFSSTEKGYFTLFDSCGEKAYSFLKYITAVPHTQEHFAVTGDIEYSAAL